MKGFNLYLNIIAATIIGLVIIGMLVLSFNFLSKEKQKIETIKIEYQGVKIDTLKEVSKIELSEIHSLLDSIKTTSNNIQIRQLKLIEEKESTNFFNKIYAAMIAIIFGIAGFFGFKSMNEIRSRAIEDAKAESTRISNEIAETTAKQEFNKIFDEEYKASVFKEAIKASTEILRSEVGNLEKSIGKIEKRVSLIEDKHSDQSENTEENNIIEETNNPFDDEN